MVAIEIMATVWLRQVWHYRIMVRRVLIGVLLYGTAVHVWQLVSGGYPWAPVWLAVYFTSLTLLDPIAAALLLRRRRGGHLLAAFVLVTDSIANGYATYVLGAGGAAAKVAHAVITALAALSLLPLWRSCGTMGGMCATVKRRQPGRR